MKPTTETALELYRAERCPAGYRWRRYRPTREIEDEAGRTASESEPEDELPRLTLVPLSDEVESYIPPDDLFLTLAQAEPTSDAALELANKYGPLSLAALQFTMWKYERDRLLAAVTLYGALRDHAAGDSGRLHGLIQWQSEDTVAYEGPGGPFIIASPYVDRERLKHFAPRDLAGPARYQLQELINAGLKAGIEPKLLWNLERTRLTLRLVPDNLESCVWLQLAAVIDGARTYRQCRSCSKWMLVAREGVGKRPSRYTCSDACRMQLYLGRQAEARRLRREGVSTQEIARRLSTEPRIVKGWVTKASK